MSSAHANNTGVVHSAGQVPPPAVPCTNDAFSIVSTMRQWHETKCRELPCLPRLPRPLILFLLEAPISLLISKNEIARSKKSEIATILPAPRPLLQFAVDTEGEEGNGLLPPSADMAFAAGLSRFGLSPTVSPTHGRTAFGGSFSSTPNLQPQVFQSDSARADGSASLFGPRRGTAPVGTGAGGAQWRCWGLRVGFVVLLQSAGNWHSLAEIAWGPAD